MFTSKVVMQLLSKRKYQNRDIIYLRNTRNSTPRESSGGGKRPDQRPTSGKSRRSNSWESRSRSPIAERRQDRQSSGRSRSPAGERRQDRPSSGRSRNSNRQGSTSGKSRNSNEERNHKRSTPSRRRSSTPLKARDLVTMRSTFLDKRKSTRGSSRLVDRTS